MSTPSLHESAQDLTSGTREIHRAIASLIEELEAVDWYSQRIEAADDEALAEILTHNRDEEKEHACMVLEWIRRGDPVFDRMLRRFLFTDAPIVGVEEGDADGEASAAATPGEGSLGIGSLRAPNASRENAPTGSKATDGGTA